MSSIKLSEPEGQKPKRTEILTILCILSFIGSGLAGFSNLIIALAYNDLDKIIASSKFDIPGLKESLNAGRPFFAISFVLYLLSFTGVMLMWKLKKTGFHIYAISQIILLIIPSFFLPDLGFPTLAVMISAIFILLYATNLRVMK